MVYSIKSRNDTYKLYSVGLKVPTMVCYGKITDKSVQKQDKEPI